MLAIFPHEYSLQKNHVALQVLLWTLLDGLKFCSTSQYWILIRIYLFGAIICICLHLNVPNCNITRWITYPWIVWRWGQFFIFYWTSYNFDFGFVAFCSKDAWKKADGMLGVYAQKSGEITAFAIIATQALFSNFCFLL